MRKKILTIVGARPQFVKSAMLSKAIKDSDVFDEVLVHTGQHYDENMSEIFFRQMGIPEPIYNLQIGSDTHGRQTGKMLIALDEVFEKEKPDATVVYGDTNSTLAGALASVKLKIPIIHVEAGMRSYNIYQPEEANRVVADHCAALLICSSEDSAANLRKEGVLGRIVVGGDLMYDSTMMFSSKSTDEVLRQFNLRAKEYILATCHRPESTDYPERLGAIIEALARAPMRVIFPIHPRTRKYLEKYDLLTSLDSSTVQLVDPLGYSEMLQLLKHASKLVTDSGGMQKEAYFLNVPCVTVRETTEWTELVDVGWNIVTGYERKKIDAAIRNFTPPTDHPPLYGGGEAAHAIHDIIVRFLGRD